MIVPRRKTFTGGSVNFLQLDRKQHILYNKSSSSGSIPSSVICTEDNIIGRSKISRTTREDEKLLKLEGHVATNTTCLNMWYIVYSYIQDSQNHSPYELAFSGPFTNLSTSAATSSEVLRTESRQS